VIPSHDGAECASQAATVAEKVAAVKGFVAAVEDGAGVARAKRRVVVEAAVSAIDQSDMVRAHAHGTALTRWQVVLVVSSASHRDGVLRLYAHVAGIKPVVVVGECAGWPAQLVAKKRVAKVCFHPTLVCARAADTLERGRFTQVDELGSVASW